MKHPNLQVTYRKGRLLAAYLHLAQRSTSDQRVRTQTRGEFVVDFAGDGRALGIEIIEPSKGLLTKLNALLGELGHAPLTKEDVAPIVAA